MLVRSIGGTTLTYNMAPRQWRVGRVFFRLPNPCLQELFGGLCKQFRKSQELWYLPSVRGVLQGLPGSVSRRILARFRKAVGVLSAHSTHLVTQKALSTCRLNTVKPYPLIPPFIPHLHPLCPLNTPLIPTYHFYNPPPCNPPNPPHTLRSDQITALPPNAEDKTAIIGDLKQRITKQTGAPGPALGVRGCGA